MNYIAWLILFVILAIFELITMGLVSIWFALGALAACIASALGAGWMIQAVVFIVVSIAVLLIVRPFAVNYINNNTEKTNVDAMIDKVGEVTEDIDNIRATGKVIVNGMEWTARSKNEAIIEKGKLVRVLAIEGVKVIVEEK